MTVSDSRLIELLKQHYADRTKASDSGIHLRMAAACVPQEKLSETEESLGFALPAMVRALYTQVCNGGFGPGYGIVGTQGGIELDGCTLETCYQQMLQLADDCPIWRCWPHELLPLASYGCGLWFCVDCTYPDLPMFLWEPNNLDSGLEADDAQPNWGSSFWDQGLSLRSWLLGWLNSTEEPEPKWPSPTWTKTRLGFVMP